MEQSAFLSLIQIYATALLNASCGNERVQIANEIAADPDLAASILMLFSEQLAPMLPSPVLPVVVQETVLQ